MITNKYSKSRNQLSVLQFVFLPHPYKIHPHMTMTLLSIATVQGHPSASL